MPGYNDADLRHPFIQREPATIKQLYLFVRAHLGDICCWRVGQHTLEVRMVQDAIASSSSEQEDADSIN